MYSKFLLLLTTLVLASTLWVSCDDEQDAPRPPGPPHYHVGSIQIVTGVPNDTLYFAPGDSVSTTITVIVTNRQGLAYPGVPVDLILANATVGALEFTDSILVDTTNHLGRVLARYRCDGVAHDQIISATAGDVTAQRIMVIREEEAIPSHLSVDITPYLLEADSNEEVQFQVDVWLWDQFDRGIAGRRPMNYFPVGGTEFPPDTDSLGHSSFVWVLVNNFGMFTFITEIDSLIDSAKVEVHLREQEPQPYAGEYNITSTFPADTLWFLPGDSTFAPFVVNVYDTLGQPAPGVRVDFVLANPTIGQIEFTDNYLWDTTNTYGAVHGVFRSFAVAGDQIIFPCVRDSCAPIFFAIRELPHEPPQVNIYTIPANLRVDSNTVGEAFIVVTASDENGILLPNVTPTLTVEVGEFDPPPPTDANGQSQTTWRFFNNFGAFQVTTSIEHNSQTATDSTLINVLYGP